MALLTMIVEGFICLWKNDSGLQENVKNEKEHPRITLINFVKNFSYPIEVYQDIETDDHYLLDVYRIPYGKSRRINKTAQRPVVLIMHGMMSSCMDYLLFGPKRSLAYILADCGYDVWLANSRGSVYSNGHKYMNTSVDKKYWNFSFHEVAIYDLPAVIKLIQKTTSCQTISYIAHSQGTTAMFVLLSEKPEYNKLFNIIICFAPIHTIANIQSTMMSIATKNSVIWRMPVNLLGIVQLPTESIIKFVTYIGKNFCSQEGVIQYLVMQSMFLVFGGNDKQLNKKELPNILTNILNPSSVKTFVHYCQMTTGSFKQFDAGPEENMKLYGRKIPPNYDLSKVTAPVALFHSNGDGLCGPKDVALLRTKLPNIVYDHLIEDQQFAHMDFSFAKDAVNLLYRHVLLILENCTITNV